MDRSLYIAMSGAKQTLLAQTANANNLANANTTGFKADLEQFRSQPVFGAGFPTRVYAQNENPGTNFTAGALQTTGRNLDVAVSGDGWLAVQSPSGAEAYTRAGDLRVSPEGLLQTGSGLQVIGQGGPIAVPPFEKLDIGKDGTISIIPLGNNAANVAVIDRIKLVNPPLETLEKGADGLIHSKDAAPVAADANVNLVPGALEASNVNSIQAMVDMIELAKSFELQTKVMNTAKDNANASSELLKLA
ncbi:MAG: flagellar basal-body rod protein FlgF [Methylobacter sp.]|nr:MAG: flagellar basal-body rod protein FlgF [Methylobacter sp.]PPD36827.1 MAG: flagellar basal-body rod protein FlgF [Methylomonas sp.]